MTTLSIHSPP